MSHDQIRRMVRSLYFIAVLGVANIHCVYAQESPKGDATRSVGKIDPEVIETVRSSGTARVLVSLNVQINTSEKLRPDERKAQSEKISSTQGTVLKELVGTQYKLIRKLDNVPTLIMEVRSDALLVLEHSPLVLRVHATEKTYPHMEEVVPHEAK
jgi:hypothetical protein